MSLDNEHGFEDDLNLDIEQYGRLLVGNRDFYGDGFFFYQIQTGLEGAPRGDEIFEDLETLADEGLLERERIGSSSKMPDTEYFLATEDDTEETSFEAYMEMTRDWVDSYTESLENSIPPTV